MRGHSLGKERQPGSGPTPPRGSGDRRTASRAHKTAGGGGTQHGLSGDLRRGGSTRDGRFAAGRGSFESRVSARGRRGPRFYGARAPGSGRVEPRSRGARGCDLWQSAGHAVDRIARHGRVDQVRLQRVPCGEYFFSNEMGALAGQLGIDGAEVMDTLCRDHALNISRAYLKPGFAFGGSCLPKDLRALVYRASRLDLKLPLLESVLPSNNAQLDRAIQVALDLAGERIGVFGLAFKENTDDLRESPVVRLLETLIGKGRKVRVYDPHIQLGEIYGSNQRYIMNAIPHIGNLLDASLEAMLQWADHVLVAQKPPAETLLRLEQSGKPLVDLVGALRKGLSGASFSVPSLGRRAS